MSRVLLHAGTSPPRVALRVVVAAIMVLAAQSLLVATSAPPARASAPPARASATRLNRIVHTDPVGALPDAPRPRRRAAGPTAGSSAAALSQPPCSATHSRGYQILYAHPIDVASRIGTVQPKMLADAAAAGDRVTAESAQAPVRPRFFCGVTDVQTPRLAAGYGSDPMWTIIGDLDALGYNLTSKKYVVWWDGNPHPYACGEGTFANDERADPSVNSNNIGPDYAVVYKPQGTSTFCGWTTVLHEMGHTLGSVMHGAPHSTVNWHCSDENDIMCYADGPGVTITTACAGSYEYFDCNKDDYFSAAPASGSYLATHWNTYRSSWLESAPASSSTPPPSPTPTPQPTAGTDVTPPNAAMLAPTASVQIGRAIGVSWSGSDNSGTSPTYTVRYRAASTSSAFGSYAPWLSRTSATNGSFNGTPGATYCFAVQAKDTAGNVSAWTADRCTAVPLDDRNAVFTNVERGSGSSFYLGTVAIGRVSGGRLSWRGLRGRSFSLAIQMCKACRYADVVWNGTVIKKMSLYADIPRIVTVPLMQFSGVQSGTLDLVVRSPVIVIDSLGVSQV